MTELSENDKVELRVQDGNITIIPVKKHISLAERIAEYEEEYKCEEWDVGTPKEKRYYNGIYTRARRYYLYRI